MQNQTNNNPKLFGCVGLLTGLLAFLICFIPFIGAYGMGLGLFGIIFSGITYHLLKKENKRLTLPIISLALGITGFCVGGYQLYTYKAAFDTISQVNKKKKEGIFRIVKHFFFKKDAGVEKTLDEVFPNRHDIYFLSIVDKLRVRMEPNLDSEIVGHLDFGDKALFLKEESSHKDSIEIAGAMRYSNWKKVKFPGDYLGHEISGWAYGGALVEPSKSFIQSTDDKYIKTIYRNSNTDIAKLLGIEINEDFTFHGLVSYNLPKLKTYTKEGEFRIIGFSAKGVSDLYEFQSEVAYRGFFKANKLDGLFSRDYNGYEWGDLIKIKYENGICTWFSIRSQQEDVINEQEEASPQDCSFEYIQGSIQ